jgi:hypothetical protein
MVSPQQPLTRRASSTSDTRAALIMALLAFAAIAYYAAAQFLLRPTESMRRHLA